MVQNSSLEKVIPIQTLISNRFAHPVPVKMAIRPISQLSCIMSLISPYLLRDHDLHRKSLFSN